MKTFSLFIGVLLASGPAIAGPEQTGKPLQVCEQQNAQCMKQCDKQKRMWFFKGEAYESCAEKCEARHQSCLANDMNDDKFEVIPPRGEAEKRRGSKDRGKQPPVSMDEAEEEDLESVDKPAEEKRAGAGEHQGKGQGKGKGKGQGGGQGKNKDKKADELDPPKAADDDGN